MRCFGAQAAVCGILLSTATMDKTCYKIWLGAMAPFFIFDWVAYKHGFLTPVASIADAAGNAVFVICSAYGAGFLTK